MATTMNQPATTNLPTLRYPIGDTVVPGDRLGTIRQVQAGSGTHVHGWHVYASLVGRLQVSAVEEALEAQEAATTTTTTTAASNTPAVVCWIEATNTSPNNNGTQSKPLATARVLQVGQLVLGKISRITPQNAVVEISVVEGVGSLSSGGPSSSSILEGAIRREDIRGGATEELAIEDCFQPGDTVACRVLSLGDARRYVLTTAETELGVLRAVSRTSGQVMIPISWKEMQCPETGAKESRKCAKPGGGGGGGGGLAAPSSRGDEA